MQEPGEGIVTPLNDRHLIVQVQIGETMAHVNHLELENAKTLRSTEDSGVGAVGLMG